MTVNNSICVIIPLQESTMAAPCCKDGGKAIKKRLRSAYQKAVDNLTGVHEKREGKDEQRLIFSPLSSFHRTFETSFRLDVTENTFLD